MKKTFLDTEAAYKEQYLYEEGTNYKKIKRDSYEAVSK